MIIKCCSALYVAAVCSRSREKAWSWFDGCLDSHTPRVTLAYCWMDSCLQLTIQKKNCRGQGHVTGASSVALNQSKGATASMIMLHAYACLLPAADY
jgi:hypothetical protein